MFCLKVPTLFLIPCFLKHDYVKFFNGVFFTLIICIAVIYFKSFLSLNELSINSRLDIGNIDSIWVSRLLCECILISMLILDNRNLTNILLVFTILPLAYACGSKGPVLSLCIVLLMYFLKKHKLKTKVILFTAFAISIVIFNIIKPISLLEADSFFVQRFLRVTPDFSSERIIEESRAVVWPMTMAKFLHGDIDKIMFGQGVGNFSNLFYGEYSEIRSYPHNLFMELLVEQGFLFFVLSIILGFWLFKRSSSIFKYFFLYYLINSMFTGDLILNEHVFFYFSCMIMIKDNTINRLKAKHKINPVLNLQYANK
jgi:O-antigen ligase